MDQPYSVWADWLSKFHTSSTLIQALWIVAATAMGLAALHTVKVVAVAALRRMRDPEIELVYGICRDRSGRLMVYPEPKEPRLLPEPMPAEGRRP